MARLKLKFNVEVLYLEEGEFVYDKPEKDEIEQIKRELEEHIKGDGEELVSVKVKNFKWEILE